MTDPPIQIITDSTCDIPQALVDQYQIHIVSHYVIWGTDQYRDRVNLSPEEFYRRLEIDPNHPTSAQATELDFLDAYPQKSGRIDVQEIFRADRQRRPDAHRRLAW
jgi:fatty acid-binding protein DegV